MYFQKSAVRTVFFFGMVCLIFSLSAPRAFSSQITLAWDANKEDNLAGYYAYCGTSSGNYTNRIDVGNYTQYTFSNLQAGVTYFFAVTAYNTDYNASDYSQELIYTVPLPDSSNPINVFEPSTSSNSPLSGHYILTFDVTGITDPIQGSKISLFFENSHDQITIYRGNDLITTVDDVAARQWYDIDLPDIITQNEPNIFIIKYDPYQEWLQEENHAELTVVAMPPQEAPDQAPIAAFTAEPAFGEASLTVNFDAGQTYDPDGQIVNYKWDFGDGCTDESGADVYHHFSEAGLYNVVLTVTDDDGLQAAASDTVEVVVQPLNPVDIVFEPSTSSNSPLSGHYILTFDVTGITDPIQGSKISLFFENSHDQITIYHGNDLITTVDDVAARQWYDIDLPDIITQNEPNIFIIKYDPYQEWLQEENHAELTVVAMPPQEAPDQAPIAAFTAQSAFGEASLTVNFDAGQTYDPDGQIVNYKWDFGDGCTDESGADVYHHFSEAGLYNVVLTVTDDDGLQAAASDTVEVVVQPLNPVDIVFEPSTSSNSPLSGHYILTFDVTGITDPIQGSKISLFFENSHDQITIYRGNDLITTVDDVAARQWYDIDLPDIITQNEPNIFIIKYDPYQEWLQEENHAELTVVAMPPQEAPDQAPIAAFTAEPAFGEASLTVNFDAGQTYDPDGQIVNYKWDFGDGCTDESGADVYHHFSEAGLYNVVLTVTDDDGLQAASFGYRRGGRTAFEPRRYRF